MSDEMKLARAKQVYETICSALDQREWHYKQEEERFLVYFGVRGDDLPLNFIIRADAERQLVRLHSPVPYKMPEDKRIDGAIATSVANYRLSDGTFEYNLGNGEIVFKMTATYRGAQINEELIHYMIGCSCAMVDEFNDGFMGVGQGVITLAQFVEKYS